MEIRNEKTFVDSVHGQIKIPNEYCKNIIDTAIFQRLRRIEQTSMRGIYPSAHHDRFVHSLGTYYLGSKMFDQIHRSLEARAKQGRRMKDGDLYDFITHISLPISQNKSNGWECLKKTFELACLLHDCGHAPFSHTCEDYYSFLPPKENTHTLFTDVINKANDYIDILVKPAKTKNRIKKQFKEDLKDSGAKPHELTSAWLVLHEAGFREKVRNLGADPLLMARMITGCKYIIREEEKKKQEIISNIDEDESRNEKENIIFNCFISLLNGNEIDADRLDYALRDNWASGVNSTSINAVRLITSITIARTNDNSIYDVCFSKQALPDLQCLLENKNYTYFWIFKHHKTTYQERLLKKAIEKLAIVLGGDETIETYYRIKEKKDTEEDRLKFGVEQGCNDYYSLLENGLKQQTCFELFNYENLIKPIVKNFTLEGVPQTETLYLLSDDDIVYLLKKYFNSAIQHQIAPVKEYFKADNYAMEWLSRQQELLPVWKSFSEYQAKYVFKHPEFAELIKLFKMLESEENFQVLKNNLKLELSEVKKYSKILYDVLYEWLSEVAKSKGNPLVLKNKLKEQLKNVQKLCTDRLQKDLEEAMYKVLEKAEDEGYEVKHVVKCEEIKVNINEIKRDKLHIYIDEQTYLYNELDLPRRSQYKEYTFFYMFVPRLYCKDEKGENKEINTDKYHEFYTILFQDQICNIKHTDEENKL